MNTQTTVAVLSFKSTSHLHYLSHSQMALIEVRGYDPYATPFSADSGAGNRKRQTGAQRCMFHARQQEYQTHPYCFLRAVCDLVRVKCSPDDTVGDLKKLIAAQTGTDSKKIQLKKWYVFALNLNITQGILQSAALGC